MRRKQALANVEKLSSEFARWPHRPTNMQHRLASHLSPSYHHTPYYAYLPTHYCIRSQRTAQLCSLQWTSASSSSAVTLSLDPSTSHHHPPRASHVEAGVSLSASALQPSRAPQSWLLDPASHALQVSPVQGRIDLQRSRSRPPAHRGACNRGMSYRPGVRCHCASCCCLRSDQTRLSALLLQSRSLVT